jgi:1-acyl-sn-glycerol-3-phosphate acyltransferase
VPIVPVGIAGSEAVMPKGARMIRPAKVHVIIGAPILPPASVAGTRVPRSAIRDVTAELHETLQRLFDEAAARVERR